MMEKYRLVEEHRGEGDNFLDEQSSLEEVRITHLGKPKNYISYAMSLFVSDTSVENEEIFSTLLMHLVHLLYRPTERERLY